MRELRPGLRHWEAPHPRWEPTEPWSENVELPVEHVLTTHGRPTDRAALERALSAS